MVYYVPFEADGRGSSSTLDFALDAGAVVAVDVKLSELDAQAARHLAHRLFVWTMMPSVSARTVGPTVTRGVT